MSEFKGTPGPWVISFRRDEVNIPIRGPHCVTATYAGSEANARLIAAAPDLLEALENILASEGMEFEIALERARTAIAKALQP